MEVDLGLLTLRVAVDMFTFPRILSSLKPPSQVVKQLPKPSPSHLLGPCAKSVPSLVPFACGVPPSSSNDADRRRRSAELTLVLEVPNRRDEGCAVCGVQTLSGVCHTKRLIDDLLGTPERVRASFCTGSMVFVGCGG